MSETGLLSPFPFLGSLLNKVTLEQPNPPQLRLDISPKPKLSAL